VLRRTQNRPRLPPFHVKRARQLRTLLWCRMGTGPLDKGTELREPGHIPTSTHRFIHRLIHRVITNEKCPYDPDQTVAGAPGLASTTHTPPVTWPAPRTSGYSGTRHRLTALVAASVLEKGKCAIWAALKMRRTAGGRSL
jgi:hypothetical protein